MGLPADRSVTSGWHPDIFTKRLLRRPPRPHLQVALDQGVDDIVYGPCLTEPFQRNFADLLDTPVFLDCGGDAGADQNLAILGGVTEPRREVADRADRGVINPLGETDLPQ